MPRIPGVNHLDAIRVFKKVGFYVDRQSRHVIMKRGDTTLMIPRQNPIDATTLGKTARAAGLTPDEFRKLL